MPTNPNMVAIQTVTVGSGGASSITFSNIPQTYTDLMVVISHRITTSYDAETRALYLKINGVTTNRTYRWLYAYSAGVGSANGTDGLLGPTPGANATANTFGSGQLYIPNYTSSNNKSFSWDNVTEDNSTKGARDLTAGLWSNSAAITSLTFEAAGLDNFAQYSTATLYGVTSAGYGAKATGGAIYQDADYFYHAFFSSGTFTPTSNITADVLVVAGGGSGGRGGTGGGQGGCGGGGAGGLLAHTSQSLTTSTNYTVTIGAGGAGGTIVGSNNGSNSQFGSLTASVGGGGGGKDDPNVNGKSGGSGGGNSYENTGTGGAATSGQGFAGGGGSTSPLYGGGGGGAAEAGNTDGGGEGGDGSSTYSTWGLATASGENVSGTYYYAGGGGGGASVGKVGGLGGGGVGSSGTTGNAGNGIANTGGGGGGSGGNASAGAAGAGGSGIVIVRYAK